ncbi:MAG TPA: hypothetical protein VMV24_02440 [Candidatus Dormibacteraeota bacterium]|nr:hypothetical protein [Candidatus Dormibacteraeota bacterium]
MSEHIFLQRHQIEPADIYEVLDMTATGQLEWGRSYTTPEIGVDVDYSMGSEVAINRNLLEVKVGHNPDKTFNHLRMTDANLGFYYIDNEMDDELIVLAKRVLQIGNTALTIANGKLSGTIKECGTCERPTGHWALKDASYRFSETMMTGSDRKECVVCGN